MRYTLKQTGYIYFIFSAVTTFAIEHYDDTQLVAIFLLTASLIGISKTMLFFEMNTESFQSTDKRLILNFDSIINCLAIVWLVVGKKIARISSQFYF